MFIAIEGMDGSGKTSLIQLLKGLRVGEKEIITVRDPGGTSVAENIREIVKTQNPVPMAELLLFLAAKYDLYEKIIHPAIVSGKIVISDRWYWSTYVYQGVFRGLKDILDKMPVSIKDPDLVIYLDLPVEESIRRINRRENRPVDMFDDISVQSKTEMRKAYLQLAKSPNAVIIDANKPISMVSSTVHHAILQVLDKKEYLSKHCINNV